MPLDYLTDRRMFRQFGFGQATESDVILSELDRGPARVEREPQEDLEEGQVQVSIL